MEAVGRDAHAVIDQAKAAGVYVFAGGIDEDLAGRVVRWNRALAQMYGLSAGEARGHKLEEVFDGPFVEWEEDRVRRAGRS